MKNECLCVKWKCISEWWATHLGLHSLKINATFWRKSYSRNNGISKYTYMYVKLHNKKNAEITVIGEAFQGLMVILDTYMALWKCVNSHFVG